MKKIDFAIAVCASIVSVVITGCAFADVPAPGAIRVVPCNKPVQSAKRGVCVNKMSTADFMALAPGVSWWYNWHFTPTMDVPKEANMEFLPMAWGARREDVDGLKAYLKDHKPRRILALNEPNLKGQAFISPQQTAEWYKKIKAVADEYKIPVVGPNMSLGSAENDSIKAMDPIEKKEVTYTYMVPFLKAFLNYMGDAPVYGVAAHSYGNFGELNWMTGMMRDDFKRPVWVTEFAQWGAKDLAAEQEYMIQSVDLFERTPEVEGYAWFKERADNEKISLLEKESGKLTMLGQTYVNMPVHDPSVYYRLPGRLQAESHVKVEKSNIALTTDGDGFLEMQTEKGGVLNYNVAVPSAGEYSVKIRCKTSEGTKFEILSGDTVLGEATTKDADWQTVETSVKLPAGNQTLRVRLGAYARFNWIEFSKK
jgi:hypothetical protein